MVGGDSFAKTETLAMILQKWKLSISQFSVKHEGTILQFALITIIIIKKTGRRMEEKKGFK